MLRFRRCDPRVKASPIFMIFAVPPKFRKSLSASALLFSPLGLCFFLSPTSLPVTFACVRVENSVVNRTKRCREEGVSKFSLARKVAGVRLGGEGGRGEELF